MKLLAFERPSPVPTSSPTNSDNSPSSEDGPELSPSPPPLLPESLWISCWSGAPTSRNRSLEFIISATQGHLGPHPIFIVPVSIAALSRDDIKQRMQRIATELLDLDLGQRVFSVFAPKCLAQEFATAWCSAAATIPLEGLYDAFQYRQCTRNDLETALPSVAGHRMRRARSSDVEHVALLCESFSNTTPYPVTFPDARREATSLIADKALFVYEVPLLDGGRQIVSIVAAGRKTPDIAGITTLHTSLDHEGRGYATRLLHHVCSRMFDRDGREAVVFYIPRSCTAGERVAQHVGFRDVPQCSKGEWLEIGFQDAEPGHW